MTRSGQAPQITSPGEPPQPTIRFVRRNAPGSPGGHDPAEEPNRPPDDLHEQCTGERVEQRSLGRRAIDLVKRHWWEWPVLAGILIAAAALRLAGIGWGDNYYYHPDELFMTMVLTEIHGPGGLAAYLDTATSPLNPYNSRFDSYVYGTVPLFAAKLLGSLTSHEAFGEAHLPGRWLSAAADVGSVLVIFWIGRRMFGRAVALLAAFLLAFTMLNIQAAHYFTTDAMSAFLATATFGCILHGWHRRSFAWFALAGLTAGLAAASKPNLLLSVGFLALPILETIRLHGWRVIFPSWMQLFGNADEGEPQSEGGARRSSMSPGPAPFPILFASVLSGFVAIWTFRFAQPYAFAGPSPWSFRLNPQWTTDLAFWRSAQEGTVDLPPSVQWAERTPIVFVLDNLVRWGMGPALGIAALAGLAILLVRIVTSRSWPSWWVLGIAGWVLFHIVFFGTGLAKVQRYLLPAYPLLVLLGAATLVGMVRWAHAGGRLPLPGTWRLGFPRWIHPGYLLPVIAVIGTVFHAVAFTTVFTREHTRTAASEWIFANVPAGSTIATEYWDFGLPVWLPGEDASQYPTLALDLYRTDSSQKLSALIGQLQRTDYIVISSNRLFESIPRMPWRYPMTTVYYEALFSGALGFDRVAYFRSSPELFGITIDDRGAEESLTVYDHPEVFIFKKSDRWSDDAAWYLLNDALGDGGLDLLPVQTQPDRMMLDETEQARLRDSGTWREMFDPGSIANRWPVPFWYLALQVLSIPAIPLLWRMVPWLPDRGYALTKTFGLLATAWITWLLASLHLLEFGPGAIASAWIVVMAIAAMATRGHLASLVSDLRRRRSWIFATEAMLTLLLVAGAWARSHLPSPLQPGTDATGMDHLAAFNAVVRSTSFPPYDPWLAGGTLHDMYLGLVPWAVVTRLTGIVPEVAWSLSLVTLFALIFVNAWIAGATLLRALRGTDRDRSERRVMPLALVSPLLLLLGPAGFAQRIETGAWNGSAEGGILAIIAGIRRALTTRPDLPADAWVAASRVSGDRVLPVPLLDVLGGDLTLFLQSMPAIIAATAITGGFAVMIGRATAPEHHAIFATLGGRRAVAPFAILTGLTTGFLLGANWLMAIPMLALVAGLAFLATGARTGWLMGWAMLRDVALLVVTVGAIGCVMILPFLAHYGAYPRRRLPVEQTLDVPEYLWHYGVFVAIVGGYLLAQLWRLGRDLMSQGPISVVFGGVAAILLGACLVLATRLDLLILFLVLVMGIVGIMIWFHQHDVRHLVPLGMVTLVLALSIASERFRLERVVGEQDIGPQFLGMVWILFAIASVPALMLLLDAAARRNAARSGPPRAVAWPSLALVAVLVLATATYPALAIPNRMAARASETPSLDSYIAMPGDVAAIDWMRTNIHGRPIVLEGTTVDQAFGGRISAMTGYPTVIGPTSSEREQRPGMERLIDDRFDAVNAIYDRPVEFDLIEPLVQSLGVELIYVGPYERALYSEIGLAKFDRAVETGELTEVYEREDVAIYRYVHRDGEG
jgi:YYY domain-containing protein